MKIISKYRDYYDYLSGIWGEDPKLILDRREFTYQKYTPPKGKITLIICDLIYEGYFDGENYYWGEDLKQFGELNKKSWATPKYNSVYIENSMRGIWEDEFYAINPIKDKNKTNIKENCPILIRKSGSWEKFPILSELNIISILPPKDIYQMLVDWLSERINERENERGLNITNVQKLESKGFDKITSFRPKIKL